MSSGSIAPSNIPCRGNECWHRCGAAKLRMLVTMSLDYTKSATGGDKTKAGPARYITADEFLDSTGFQIDGTGNRAAQSIDGDRLADDKIDPHGFFAGCFHHAAASGEHADGHVG